MGGGGGERGVQRELCILSLRSDLRPRQHHNPERRRDGWDDSREIMGKDGRKDGDGWERMGRMREEGKKGMARSSVIPMAPANGMAIHGQCHSVPMTVHKIWMGWMGMSHEGRREE